MLSFEGMVFWASCRRRNLRQRRNPVDTGISARHVTLRSTFSTRGPSFLPFLNRNTTQDLYVFSRVLKKHQELTFV